MIVCPVCEHAQPAGAECEVCGRLLVEGTAAIPDAPPVEGLEPTHLAGAGAAASVPPVPDLEPTLRAPVEAPPDATPDVEPTRAAPVDVDAPPLAGIERLDAAIPGDAPTAIPAFVSCRYCRTPAAPGERICARCGMRLPSFEAAAPEEAAGRLCSCGTQVTRGLCPSCGARA